jgi:hypothetical protein
MTITGTPTLDELKAWLGLDPADEVDDVVLQDSLNAALAAQARIVVYPAASGSPDEQEFTDDLRTAIWLRAQRLAARRNSPEGVVGISSGSGDFAGARLPPVDVDVARLEAPWTTITVA